MTETCVRALTKNLSAESNVTIDAPTKIPNKQQ